MKILVTGGTTFVSKFVARYFVEKGNEVYVLNRNTKPQVEGVKIIKEDRHNLGNKICDFKFDTVLDITAYNEEDVMDLSTALGKVGQYIMISSSAVYPEYENQPFVENSKVSKNKFWGKYGTDKIKAESAVLKNFPDAYILRPPYLYGPMNNIYREAFVFDCARNGRKFYLPGNGEMKLQFLHVHDLCKIIENIMMTKPENQVLNVGNVDTISIKDWVILCYKCFDKVPVFEKVSKDIEQRKYFPFYNYEYYLDVKKQQKLLKDTIDMETGLRESADWYLKNETEVNKKPYFEYIDRELS